jgi:hypothetical protein
VHGHLGGVRARDEVRRADEVQEVPALDPPAACDHLVFQHGDVHGRPAEGDDAELQEEPRQLAQAALRSGVLRRPGHAQEPFPSNLR